MAGAARSRTTNRVKERGRRSGREVQSEDSSRETDWGEARGSRRIVRRASGCQQKQNAAPGKREAATSAAKKEGGLQRGEDVFAGDALGGGDLAQDGVEGADAQRLVVGNRQPVMARRLGLQNDMAADLVDLLVGPPGAQDVRQIAAVKIAWQLHANTSSRTRCSRKRSGAGRSK